MLRQAARAFENSHLPQETGLIPWQTGIDVARPSINPTCQIAQFCETKMFQLTNRIETANAVMAVNNDFLVLPVVEFINPKRQLAEWDER